MKKLYTILNAAFWCFIGVFLGVSYTPVGITAPPRAVCAAIRTVYLSIQIHAVFTVVVCGMLALEYDFAEENVIMPAGHARPLQT